MDPRIESLRVPPHSVEAEQAVLGGLMISPAAWDRIGDMLGPDDFYRNDHRLIFKTIGEFANAGKPFDVLLLADRFEARGQNDDIGGPAYLLHLTNNTPSAANVAAYASIVAQKAMLRRLITGCTDVIARCFEGDETDPAALVDQTIGSLMTMQRTHHNAEWTLRDALRASWKRLAAAHANPGQLVGITTGLSVLDNNLGGFHPSDLIVIGGRPAMGKTAMLLGMARAAALTGKPIALISGEQPMIQVGDRIAALGASVNASRMRNADLHEDDWGKLSAAVESQFKLPFHIYDRAAPSIGEVARVLRRWKREHGIAAVYVDYLQRLEGPGQKSYERVSAVTKGLKNIARELDVPVIALAQVKRDVEERSDKRPRMRDLCDSSEIEKEADQIVNIYRDDYYSPDSAHKGTAELLIEKNRHGPAGFARCAFVADHMRFADLEPGWEPAHVQQESQQPRRSYVPRIGSRGKFAAAGGEA
jgi:replicative DNA helicase